NGATACVPILNPDLSPNLNSTCPWGFRFDSLRNKVGMVHASGTDLTQLEVPLESQVVASGQPSELPPIMGIGVGIYSWDARVNGRPNVIYDGGYYYLFFEGADYAYLVTYDASLPVIGGLGHNEGNWGWGVARTLDINNGPWEKYAYNP